MMKLKKSYTFLYMPEDHSASREFRVARWKIVVPAVVVAALVVATVFYGVGVQQGNGWLPGGSRLQKENRFLEGTIVGLNGQVTDLRTEIDGVREVQNMMAAAINLPQVDDETFAAGIGGRGHLDYAAVEVPGAAVDAGRQFGEMSMDLDQMLRQARIQRQGYLAMLDTLSARDAVRRHIPSIRPTDIGWMSSRFGFRTDPFTGNQTFHRGLDFSVPLGTEVRVTGDGTVLAVQQQRGFGRVVKIDHGQGVVTVYAHLDQALVKKGDRVSRGDIIAKSGNSGRSSAPHLHYEIRIGGRPVNPRSYILDSYAARD
jgi:murein DD-endopeptidase MepM/ murein hydrolase activator NlpD